MQQMIALKWSAHDSNKRKRFLEKLYDFFSSMINVIGIEVHDIHTFIVTSCKTSITKVLDEFNPVCDQQTITLFSLVVLVILINDKTKQKIEPSTLGKVMELNKISAHEMLECTLEVMKTQSLCL